MNSQKKSSIIIIPNNEALLPVQRWFPEIHCNFVSVLFFFAIFSFGEAERRIRKFAVRHSLTHRAQSLVRVRYSRTLLGHPQRSENEREAGPRTKRPTIARACSGRESAP